MSATATKPPVNRKAARSPFEERALAFLKSRGYRITMPRVQVIRALAASETALTAYQIHAAILEGAGSIDVVSVYRILKTLGECGLIYKLGAVDGYFRKMCHGFPGVAALVVDVATKAVTEIEIDDVISQIVHNPEVAAAAGTKNLVGVQVEVSVGSEGVPVLEKRSA